MEPEPMAREPPVCLAKAMAARLHCLQGNGGSVEPAFGRAGKVGKGSGVKGSGKGAGSGCRFTMPAISCSVSFELRLVFLFTGIK